MDRSHWVPIDTFNELKAENERLREHLLLEREAQAKKLDAIAKGIGRLQEAMRGEWWLIGKR